MKISVIIPVRNEEANIRQAIERAISMRPHEVIVVDGESADATLENARDAECVVLQSAAGRAKQQNTGAKQATGDVLLFLHADCWFDCEAITQITELLDDERIAGGAFVHRIDAPGFLFRLIERGDSLRVRLLRSAYGDQGIFVRRDVFHSLGGFPDVRLMEDVLFIRRLRKQSRIALLPGPLHTSARRWQKHGVIRQTLRNWFILTAEKLGVSPDKLAAYYEPHWRKS
ncbi:MAG: glycosyltransferase [Planctomycetaceae bacterium]|nr:glycosyltransferase [Planctomycetaceae bacterium]